MNPLQIIATNFTKLSFDLIFLKVFKRKDVEDFIIDLNTRGQLFEGIDSEGSKLENIGGSYSPNTVRRKQRQGLPTDRVTLFDTGDFYSSFTVEVKKGFLVIKADTRKRSIDLQERWGTKLIGLTDENFEALQDFIKKIWIEEVERFVFMGL